MSQSRAQVTIKERVDIGGHPNVTGHKVLTDGEAIWVAPASGWWKLRVTAAWQTLVPISSSAYFQVITPQGTFTGNITEWASQPNNLWLSFWDYCTGRDTSGWLYAIGGVIPYDRTLAIHVVSAGDTLRFRYYADFGVSEFSQVYQDPHPEWVIKMWLEHPCIVNFDICQLHLTYFYDTTFTRFAVETLKDTIAHGDTLDFHVVAMSALNQETPLAGDTPLTLRISPSEYGRFITQTGGPVPSPLDSIRYQDAREGRIRFVAKGTSPDSLQPVSITAIQMSDTTKRGSDTVYIRPGVDTLVTFVRPTLAAVYPTYPGHNNATTATDSIDLELRVTYKNDSIPNYWVRIERSVLVDSGGHSHDGNRPMGKYKYPRTSTSNRDTILERTDSTGRIRFRYVASQFGGVERIKARLLSDTTKFDTLSLITRVPGLQLLPAGTNYTKIGGTCQHRGPDDDAPSACQTPDNNHWAIASVITNIQNIATAYRQQFPNEQRLNINDMSLPFGGRFDLDALWVGNSNHQYHRLGTDVDIRSTTIPDDDRYADTNRNGRYDPSEPITFDLNSNGQYDRTNTAFETICRRNNVLRVRLEHPGVPRREHYHLYFQQYWR